MGSFQATAKDIRTTIGYVVLSLSEMADNENKMFVRSYEPIRDSAWEGCSDSAKRMMEEDYLQKKEAHEKLMAKLKAKIQGISEAMAQNTLDAAKQMIIEQGLVETVYTGLTRLSAEIEAIRAAKNKPLLDDLDMQAVLDRFDSFRQGADDYVDVYKWLCIVAVNKWLMGEPVAGDDEHEPERPVNDKLTRAQELIIRTILKKVINRITLDFENEIKLNNKRKKNNDKLRDTYLSQKISDKSVIERINREYQAVSDQLDKIHDTLSESRENWDIFAEMFFSVLKNESFSKTKDFLDSIMAIELRRGLSLLQKDIKKRRINKPNIEDPEYIEKIIREYKEYRVNFKEYQEITYWLNIAEADKWLEYVVQNSKEDYGNNIINTLSYGLDELEEQEDFEKSKKQSYIDFGSDIKEKLSEPEKTFLGLSAELIDFIKKRKRKITEQTLRELTWWFFEKDSTDKDGMPCKGIGTREELTEFYVRYNDFTRMCLVKTHATIQIEELIQGLHDEAPENAIICLEGLLKQNEKRDLREAHLGMIDINADWRHYIIEIIKKEIQFHERRLELEKNESKKTPNIDAEKRSDRGSENAHDDAITATTGQGDSASDALKKPGRKEKLSMDVFKKEIYPEMKARFPDSKHVAGKKAYCTEIGKKYGVSEKTIRDKFDQCNNKGE